MTSELFAALVAWLEEQGIEAPTMGVTHNSDGTSTYTLSTRYDDFNGQWTINASPCVS